MLPDAEWKRRDEVVYRVRSDGPLVRASLDDASRTVFKRRYSTRPQTPFTAALDAYQQAFFRGPVADQLSWTAHRKLAAAAKHGGATELDGPAKEEWPLAWYWKAFFFALQDWTDRCEKRWFIKIAQLRHWALAYFYSVGADGKQKLLHPPIFGPSRRLLRSDSYFTLLEFQQLVVDEWKVAPKTPGYDSYIERAYVLGRNDFEYRIDRVTRESNGDLLVTVRANVDLYPFRIPHNHEMLEGTIVKKAVKGLPNGQMTMPHDMAWIPSFANGGKPRKPMSFLLASESTCRAMEKLSEVWNDPTANSILIIAPPGSGKEILAESVYRLRSLPHGAYCAYALSPSDHESNQFALYSRDVDSTQIRKDIETLVQSDRKGEDKPRHHKMDGLVFQARKGVLFLDEIDKVNDDTRASLLRLLESDQCALYDTPMTIHLKRSRPLYVFAGSMPQNRMFRLDPADFWTRISHVIESEHPLDVDHPDERERLCGSYFHMFWIRHCLDVWKSQKFQSLSKVPLKKRPASTMVRQTSEELLRFFLREDVIVFLSRSFAEEVCTGREKVEFSVRNIRSVVTRSQFALLEYLWVDRAADSGLTKIQNELVTRASPSNAYGVIAAILRGEDSGLITNDMTDQVRREMRGIEEQVRREMRRSIQQSVAKVFV